MTASSLNFAAAGLLPPPHQEAKQPGLPLCCPSEFTFGWVEEAGFSSSIRLWERCGWRAECSCAGLSKATTFLSLPMEDLWVSLDVGGASLEVFL